jgi:DUF4097 and DUF4098 domain-containing protein YvlB
MMTPPYRQPGRHALPLALAVVLAAAATAGAAGARDEVVRTERRTLNPADGASLDIDHGSGPVRITASRGRELLIEATFRVSAGTREAAAQFANAMQLEVTSGAVVRVRITTPQWTRGNRDVGFAVDLDVQVPERMPLSVTNRFGETLVRGMRSPVTMNNGNGRLVVEDGAGSYNLRNRFGTIEVRRITGDVVISGDNGQVSAEAVSGSVTANSRFGSVALSDIGGQVRVEGSNGPIVIRDARGGATVSANFGQVLVERIGGPLTIVAGNGNVAALTVTGATDIATRFGSVALRDVNGTIVVKSSNGPIDAALPAKGCQQVHLETSFGPLVVYAGDGGYALKATTGFGSIVSEVPVRATGTLSTRPGQQSSVSGEIGNGGCLLQLVNRNGNITIKAGPPPAPTIQRDGPPERAPRAPRMPPPGTAPAAPAMPAPTAPPAPPFPPGAPTPAPGSRQR